MALTAIQWWSTHMIRLQILLLIKPKKDDKAISCFCWKIFHPKKDPYFFYIYIFLNSQLGEILELDRATLNSDDVFHSSPRCWFTFGHVSFALLFVFGHIWHDATQIKAMKKVAGKLKLELAQFTELEVLESRVLVHTAILLMR